MPPPVPASDPDADLLADEGPDALSNHSGYFQGAEEALTRELHSVYQNRGGALEDTPGYVPGRFIMKAIKCASWASHEDLRIVRHRMISAALRSGRRLVDASTAGAEKVVKEIAALKTASDETARKLVRATWCLAGVTLLLAIATIALVFVEKFKH